MGEVGGSLSTPCRLLPFIANMDVKNPMDDETSKSVIKKIRAISPCSVRDISAVAVRAIDSIASRKLESDLSRRMVANALAPVWRFIESEDTVSEPPRLSLLESEDYGFSGQEEEKAFHWLYRRIGALIDTIDASCARAVDAIVKTTDAAFKTAFNEVRGIVNEVAVYASKSKIHSTLRFIEKDILVLQSDSHAIGIGPTFKLADVFEALPASLLSAITTSAPVTQHKTQQHIAASYSHTQSGATIDIPNRSKIAILSGRMAIAGLPLYLIVGVFVCLLLNFLGVSENASLAVAVLLPSIACVFVALKTYQHLNSVCSRDNA